MSMSIGLPNAAAITIGGKTTATVNALSEASEDALGERQVRADLRTETESKTEKSDSTQSIATKILLKRMQELQ